MKDSSGKALSPYYIYSSRHTPYAVTLVQITARHRWMPMRTSRRGEVPRPSSAQPFTPEERYVYRRVMRLIHALQRSAMCIARANHDCYLSPNTAGWVEQLSSETHSLAGERTKISFRGAICV